MFRRIIAVAVAAVCDFNDDDALNRAHAFFRPWDDGTSSIENAKRRVRVAFEFFQKLGVEYYTFHDRDIAPEGKNLEETNAILDEVRCILRLWCVHVHWSVCTRICVRMQAA